MIEHHTEKLIRAMSALLIELTPEKPEEYEVFVNKAVYAQLTNFHLYYTDLNIAKFVEKTDGYFTICGYRVRKANSTNRIFEFRQKLRSEARR